MLDWETLKNLSCTDGRESTVPNLKDQWRKPWQLIGFGFLQTWIFLIALNAPQLAQNSFFSSEPLAASLMVSGLLFAAVLILVLVDAFHSIYGRGQILMGACVVAAAGTLAMLLPGNSPLAAIVGIALADCGTAFLGLWWGKRWFEQQTDRTALSLALSSLVSCVLYALVDILPTEAACAFTTALPLLSGLTLLGGCREYRRRPRNPETALSPSLWRVTIMLIAIPILYSLIRIFFAQGNLASFDQRSELTMTAFAVFALAILILVATAPRRYAIVRLYRAVVAIMLAGYVAILSLPEDSRWMAMGALMLTYSLFDQLTWLMRPRIAITLGGKTINLFGWNYLVFRAAAVSGAAFGGWLLHQTWLTESVSSIGCVLMTVFIVLFFMNALTAKDFLQFIDPIDLDERLSSNVGSEQSDSSDAFDTRCRCVAEKYGLSQRETEVLQLLARGRSLSVIEEQLFISNSTARTHTRNIYRKLDVHTKQALIDLVERERPGDRV